MKWDDVKGNNCSVARALSIFGERWTLLILNHASLGVTRFDHFQTQLGISRHLLAERLGTLVAEGILSKVQYLEHPPRYEYILTPKGQDLYPLLMAIVAWGDRWLDRGAGAPVEYVHQSCGHVMHGVMVCSVCGVELKCDDVTVKPGPGWDI